MSEAAALGPGSGGGARLRAGLAPAAEVTALQAVAATELERLSSGIEEFDRVLGGGLVDGGVVLIGGDPGIGKSTLLLQALAAVARQARALYVSGEESVGQVALRAQRLGIEARDVPLLQMPARSTSSASWPRSSANGRAWW